MPRPPLLSDRAEALEPSLTLAISAQAQALQKRGYDVCSLSAGEPDFDTPDFIVEAAVRALRDGVTRYGPAAGDPTLREAIAAKLSEENGIPTNPDQVLVTNGGKQAIFNLFQIVLNPGDEVLIPSPYWLSYPIIAALAGATVRSVPSDAAGGFCLDLEALESAVGLRTRMLVLNSPANPTGRVMTLAELEGVADLLRRHPQIMILSDEIYEYLLSPCKQHRSFGNIAPDLASRCFLVNGFAKGWAMTGWRLGYLSGPHDVVAKAAALQSQSTSNVCSFAQRGALAALKGPRDCVKAMAATYDRRRKHLSAGLRGIQGVILPPPHGAFYAFPQLPENAPDSVTFCRQALERVGLAMVPGRAFGDDRCVRLSCAVSCKTITDGLSRLEFLLASL